MRRFFHFYVSIFIGTKNKDLYNDMTMDFSKDKYLQKTITEFIEHYGTSGLEQALQLYTYMQQDYVCTTKTSVSKIKIHDIYYLEIMGHHIDVHTEYGTYQKYGSLNKELEVLLPHGFIKCNQSCIVSLHKIRTIQGNDIILVSNERLYMSRHYAPNVLMAFSRNNM